MKFTYIGDIVISVDTANQAQQQLHTPKTELAWLATHGLLHPHRVGIILMKTV